MTPLLGMLDHLVYATADLEATVEEVARLLGVTPAIGGRHPGWGTRNALLSLGPRAYLEIMGPDRGQPESGRERPFGIDAISKPRLATWVARTDDIQAVIERARRKGLDLGELQERSRERPDGSLLRWKMTDLAKNREEGIVPYFIDWGDSPHPAEGAPGGCQLIALEAFHPDAARVRSLLESLGIDLRVRKGSAALKATIDGPRGRVVLK